VNKTAEDQLQTVLVENQQLKTKLAQVEMDLAAKDEEITRLREQLERGGGA